MKRVIAIGWATACAVVALGSSALAVTQPTFRSEAERAVADVSAKGAAAEDQAAREGVRKACRTEVLKQLKSPGSARWAGERIASEGLAGYTVNGELDAQNGFGALVRLSYTCTVDVQGVAQALVSQRD